MNKNKTHRNSCKTNKKTCKIHKKTYETHTEIHVEKPNTLWWKKFDSKNNKGVGRMVKNCTHQPVTILVPGTRQIYLVRGLPCSAIHRYL